MNILLRSVSSTSEYGGAVTSRPNSRHSSHRPRGPSSTSGFSSGRWPHPLHTPGIPLIDPGDLLLHQVLAQVGGSMLSIL